MQESRVFDGQSQKTCEANRMGENSSFIFKCYLKTVPVYNFQLVWVVLHPMSENFSRQLFTIKSKLTMCASSHMCLKFTPSVEINLTLKDRPKQDSRYVIILWTEGVN